MSTLTAIAPADAAHLSVERYHALIEEGVLGEDDRVELIHGRLVRQVPKSPLHETVARSCHAVLSKRLPEGWFAAMQPPLTTRDSEPEPDIMVIRGRVFDYARRHPTPADVALIIEVSHSTLRMDQQEKRRLYAESGVPLYWIANLIDIRIEAYSEPVNGDYTVRRDYRMGDTIPLTIGGREISIAVADCLPKETATSA